MGSAAQDADRASAIQGLRRRAAEAPQFSRRRGRDGAAAHFDDTVPVRASWRKQAPPGSSMPALLYIASDGDDPATIDKMLTRVDAARLIVYPRGEGEIGWDRASYATRCALRCWSGLPWTRCRSPTF